MSVHPVRPGHPLVHEAPGRNLEPLFAGFIITSAVIFAVLLIVAIFAL